MVGETSEFGSIAEQDEIELWSEGDEQVFHGENAATPWEEAPPPREPPWRIARATLSSKLGGVIKPKPLTIGKAKSHKKGGAKKTSEAETPSSV